MRNLLGLGIALLAGLSFGAPGGWAQSASGGHGGGFTINTNGSRLGIGVADVTSERAKALKLKEERGAEVTMVGDNSPASRAGLKPGDVILDFNGKPVQGRENLQELVGETPAGTEVKNRNLARRPVHHSHRDHRPADGDRNARRHDRFRRPHGDHPAHAPHASHAGREHRHSHHRDYGPQLGAGPGRGELAVVNGELTRSNTELEQFAYVASHDLQEPLRKVTSFVQLLQQRYEGQLDERADQYIEFAVDGAKRMQVLINDLLAFSRVGRTTERFADIELGAALSGALANLNDVIEETRAEVIRGPMPLVRGDESLLVSLWQNLVGNAIKFRSDKPPIVTIDVVRSGDEWVCSVSDNGLGIEPRFAEKIFVIFQRLHSRESYSGTGIGLALSKKIVEFHGGRIWLDDNHHAGTRMCFTLPVRDLEVSDEYGE